MNAEEQPDPWAKIVGPCYTSKSMARALGWTEADVIDAGSDLRLLMLHTEDDVFLFPAFQLQRGEVVEGLQKVLLVLQAGVDDPWAWAQWLNVELPDEHTPRNITLLYEGRLEEALRDARHDASAWSS
ncbi:hypothetical protein PQI51_08490 [Microbacterium esteraromaticum]|uniref:hypothetical protein n=1 Tax=Microbacterium esteraromaticum TaxID=57043 RepID=UPI0030A32433